MKNQSWKINPDDCIRCLLCFEVCPVIIETMGRAFLSPNIFTADIPRDPIIELDAIADIIYRCLSCNECTLACPRNLDTTQAVLFLRKISSRYIMKRLK